MSTLKTVPAAAVPARTAEQRLEALSRANDVRSFRAELKRRMKASEDSPVHVLRNAGSEVENMKVWDLLMAVPRFGRVKVNRMLSRARISPSKTIGGLSPRQRDELIVMVAPYVRGVRPRSLL